VSGEEEEAAMLAESSVEEVSMGEELALFWEGGGEGEAAALGSVGVVLASCAIAEEEERGESESFHPPEGEKRKRGRGGDTGREGGAGEGRV
jgi:hypothetical protein